MATYKKAIIYDIETTGFSPTKDTVLELAAVSIDAEGKTQEFSHLIKVHNVTPKITEITGITRAMVESEGRPLMDVMKDFADFCFGDCTLPLWVGHNAIDFDNRFVNPLFQRLRIFPAITEHHCFDTMRQMRAELMGLTSNDFRRVQTEHRRYKGGQKTKLESACVYYRIEKPHPCHRALNDAKNTLNIFTKQIERQKWNLLN